MDIYNIWCDKTKDIDDHDFVTHMTNFLNHLKAVGNIENFRIMRMKLGFRSIDALPEWHIMMEFKGLAQLDNAFMQVVSTDNTGNDLDTEHRSFNKYAINVQHALYRDYPDVI